MASNFSCGAMEMICTFQIYLRSLFAFSLPSHSMYSGSLWGPRMNFNRFVAFPCCVMSWTRNSSNVVGADAQQVANHRQSYKKTPPKARKVVFITEYLEEIILTSFSDGNFKYLLWIFFKPLNARLLSHLRTNTGRLALNFNITRLPCLIFYKFPALTQTDDAAVFCLCFFFTVFCLLSRKVKWLWKAPQCDHQEMSNLHVRCVSLVGRGKLEADITQTFLLSSREGPQVLGYPSRRRYSLDKLFFDPNTLSPAFEFQIWMQNVVQLDIKGLGV